MHAVIFGVSSYKQTENRLFDGELLLLFQDSMKKRSR